MYQLRIKQNGTDWKEGLEASPIAEVKDMGAQNRPIIGPRHVLDVKGRVKADYKEIPGHRGNLSAVTYDMGAKTIVRTNGFHGGCIPVATYLPGAKARVAMCHFSAIDWMDDQPGADEAFAVLVKAGQGAKTHAVFALHSNSYVFGNAFAAGGTVSDMKARLIAKGIPDAQITVYYLDSEAGDKAIDAELALDAKGCFGHTE